MSAPSDDRTGPLRGDIALSSRPHLSLANDGSLHPWDPYTGRFLSEVVRRTPSTSLQEGVHSQ